MRTCLALTSALGGALLAAIIALPAYGASASTAAVSCSQAQFDVNQAVGVEQGTAAKVATAQSAVNADQARIQKDLAIINSPTATADQIDTAKTDLASAQTQLAADQDALTNARNADNTALANITAAEKVRDAACVTPTTTPAPTTTTEPPPVGIPAQFGNCAQAARFGYHDIPSTSPRYRLALDRDRDGVACELNEGPAPVTVVRPPAPGNTTIVNPPAPPSGPNTVVIVPPSPSGGTFTNPVVPSGPVATGDGSLANVG